MSSSDAIPFSSRLINWWKNLMLSQKDKWSFTPSERGFRNHCSVFVINLQQENIQAGLREGNHLWAKQCWDSHSSQWKNSRPIQFFGFSAFFNLHHDEKIKSTTPQGDTESTVAFGKAVEQPVSSASLVFLTKDRAQHAAVFAHFYWICMLAPLLWISQTSYTFFTTLLLSYGPCLLWTSMPWTLVQ